MQSAISSVRTSTPLMTSRLMSQLNSNQIQLQDLYEQLSTGRRVNRVSDDPAAANRAISLQRSVARAEQLQRNAGATAALNASADTALGRIDNALITARATATEAAQSILSEDERAALTFTLDEVIDNVVAAGNQVFNDQQLVGGALATTPAFEFADFGIRFSGNASIANARLGSGNPLPINVSASEALGAKAIIEEGEILKPDVSRDTPVNQLFDGDGFGGGIISIAGNTSTVDIDLSPARTVGDVLDLIHNQIVDDRRISASLDGNSIRIEFFDGLTGVLSINDLAGGSAAGQLGIENPFGSSAPPLIGVDLDPLASKQTSIFDLTGGVQTTLNNGVRIEVGSQVYAVDLSEAETLEEVVIAINRAAPDVEATIDDSTGKIQITSLRSGVDYSIGENGGTDAATLGIRTGGTTRRLSELSDLDNLILDPNDSEIFIDRPDGVTLELNLEGVDTIGDVLLAINTHPNNTAPGNVTASLSAVGNGLVLSADTGVGTLQIRGTADSNAASILGLIPEGETVTVATSNGTTDTISGIDYSRRSAGGTLDTLIRLRQAVADGDVEKIGRLQDRLDLDFDRASNTRGRVGVMSRTVETLQNAAADSSIELQAQLSNELDADLATVISDVSNRQLALQASMQMIGQTAQLTVLDFL
ncbi:MAG: flagellar hook protein [Planctomycetota bacterium]